MISFLATSCRAILQEDIPMKRTLYWITLSCFWLCAAPRALSQLQAPVPPVNIIIDSDMSVSVDDVGDHAVMWALVNKGEIKVLAEICSSANDFSAPTMWAIANYYGHPDVLLGSHKGLTPVLENSATSMYTQQVAAEFGKPGDTRFNYPDAVPVYRQALASAPDHSVAIVANGYYQPLQALLQSPPDSISPLTGLQLAAQKVVRLVPGAGWLPSGNEHNLRSDADAASFVFANWPTEVDWAGIQMSLDVFTGPSLTSDSTQDPVKRAYDLFNGSDTTPGFGQVPLLFAARGLGSNFVVSGLNGVSNVENFSQSIPGQDNWFQTPSTAHSYLNKAGTARDLEAILNPLLQSSSNLPIIRSISPSSVIAGSRPPTITLKGNNFFPDSVAMVNGSRRHTTFVNSTQIAVQLMDHDVSHPGHITLNVSNVNEGDWVSSPVSFVVSQNNN